MGNWISESVDGAMVEAGRRKEGIGWKQQFMAMENWISESVDRIG